MDFHSQKLYLNRLGDSRRSRDAYRTSEMTTDSRQIAPRVQERRGSQCSVTTVTASGVYYRTPMRLQRTVIDRRWVARTRRRRNSREFEYNWSQRSARFWSQLAIGRLRNDTASRTAVIHYWRPFVSWCVFQGCASSRAIRVITVRLGRTGNNCISRRTPRAILAGNIRISFSYELCVC